MRRSKALMCLSCDASLPAFARVSSMRQGRSNIKPLGWGHEPIPRMPPLCTHSPGHSQCSGETFVRCRRQASGSGTSIWRGQNSRLLRHRGPETTAMRVQRRPSGGGSIIIGALPVPGREHGRACPVEVAARPLRGDARPIGCIGKNRPGTGRRRHERRASNPLLCRRLVGHPPCGSRPRLTVGGRERRPLSS
jgi:hypothetical protein